jgi:hypothetical protein
VKAPEKRVLKASEKRGVKASEKRRVKRRKNFRRFPPSKASPSTRGHRQVVDVLVEGDAKEISKLGITCEAKGQLWDQKGHVIGRAKTVLIVEEEEPPFSSLEGLIVTKDGYVEDENGNRVGKVVGGDLKKLVGRVVDEDGDILDQKSSVVGHAERYEQEEPGPEPEPEPQDLSILAGRTVNQQGNVIGPDGVPVGRLVEGKRQAPCGKESRRQRPYLQRFWQGHWWCEAHSRGREG